MAQGKKGEEAPSLRTEGKKGRSGVHIRKRESSRKNFVHGPTELVLKNPTFQRGKNT